MPSLTPVREAATKLAAAVQSRWRSLASKPWLDGSRWCDTSLNASSRQPATDATRLRHRWLTQHRDGHLVGHDRFGNAYFENYHGQSQRSRWVTYADKDDYSANSVPPEWFGWLHCINDWPPVGSSASQYEHPVYEVHPSGNEEEVRLDQPLSSYEPEVYKPKGYPKGQQSRWSVEVIQRWQSSTSMKWVSSSPAGLQGWHAPGRGGEQCRPCEGEEQQGVGDEQAERLEHKLGCKM